MKSAKVTKFSLKINFINSSNSRNLRLVKIKCYMVQPKAGDRAETCVNLNYCMNVKRYSLLTIAGRDHPNSKFNLQI